METRKILTILVLALGLTVCLAKVSEAAPMGTAFTYQGRLVDGNEPAHGQYDFQFELYASESSPIFKVGDTLMIDEVETMDGYFTVELDFNSPYAFTGDARWLEIGVRPGDQNDPCEYTTLEPRQEVTPTPYAIYAQMAGADNDWQVSDSNMYSLPAGNVGIGTSGPAAKLEVIQNTWTNILKAGLLTSSNRLILSSGQAWASISGGTTNRDDIVIQHSTGNVGIGTSSPDANLEVDGDLKVTGAYKGNISSSSGSDGAPFPRPAYDSGWVAITQSETKTLTHNIGGNVDNYVVDLQFKQPVVLGVNNLGYGNLYYEGGWTGASYYDLTTTSIKVNRTSSDTYAPEVRVRIWVYN